MKKKQLTAAIMTALMAVSASAYAAEQTDAHEGGDDRYLRSCSC